MSESPIAHQHDASSRLEHEQITMYSTPWCGDCRRAKHIFKAAGVPFVEVNIENDADAAELVLRLNRGMRSVPTILFPDGTHLVEPATAELAAKLVPFAAQNQRND